MRHSKICEVKGDGDSIALSKQECRDRQTSPGITSEARKMAYLRIKIEHEMKMSKSGNKSVGSCWVS